MLRYFAAAAVALAAGAATRFLDKTDEFKDVKLNWDVF